MLLASMDSEFGYQGKDYNGLFRIDQLKKCKPLKIFQGNLEQIKYLWLL